MYTKMFNIIDKIHIDEMKSVYFLNYCDYVFISSQFNLSSHCLLEYEKNKSLSIVNNHYSPIINKLEMKEQKAIELEDQKTAEKYKWIINKLQKNIPLAIQYLVENKLNESSRESSFFNPSS